MTDGTEFEPKLGRIRNQQRRPASQLKKLAHMSRYGKPKTFGRRRFAPKSIWSRGRGQGAAAAASLWADASRRRVFVRVTIAPARGANTAAFAQHLQYIQRDGTEKDGSAAKLFDRDNPDISSRDFNDRSRADDHQFRIVVSPEDAGRMEDLTAFTRRLMNQVERDLGTRVDWTAACHYNTGQPHVHIVIRGGNDRDGEIIIARKYLTRGLRYRAEDLVTQDLGNRTWRELSASRHHEALAERFTSIDRNLSRAARDGQYTLDAAEDSSGQSVWIANLRRLRHLQTLGLAEHVHDREWRFTEGWTDTLKSIGLRTALLNAVAHDLGNRMVLNTLAEPPADSVGGWITGRLGAIIEPSARDKGPMIAVEGLDGRTWMLHVPEHDVPGLPDPGAVISAYVPAMRQELPKSRHIDDNSRFADPSMIFPSLSVNSWLSIDDLTRRRAFTWLDQLSEETVSPLSSGFGADVRAAWQARQKFLQNERLDPLSREELQAAEINAVAAAEASRLGKRYVELDNREVFRGVYAKDINTAQGRFALIVGEGRFTLIPPTDDISPFQGQEVVVERSPLLRGIGPVRGRGIER